MADYVIIGGGVYGAASAWALARQGLGVHLLERHSIAAHASGGPGRRGVRANGRDRRELPLMRRAYDIWPSLHAELGAEPFYERSGQLLLFEHETDRAKAEALVWLQERNGIPSSLLNTAALREMEPRIADRVIGAVFCPNDGVADHAATTRAYAQAARRLGATIEEGIGAEKLEVEGARVTSVITTDECRIEVERGALVLANSAVAHLLRRWTTLPVWNETWQVLVSAPIQGLPFRHLIGHFNRTLALKAEGAERVMITGGWPGTWDDALAEGRPLESSVAGNVAEAVAVFPDLDGLTVETADASHQEAVSIDDLPVIDCLPGAANCLYATGWSGHGWAIAPVVAELLADWASTGRRPALLAPFAHSRFDADAG